MTTNDNQKQARAELAMNLRRFTRFTFEASDASRRGLLKLARKVEWSFLRSGLEKAALGVAAALDRRLAIPLAVLAVRGAESTLHQPIPSAAAAYQEALLISIHGPVIPLHVREILKKNAAAGS